MSRTRFLVCYDIAHPKRLRRVAKALEEYGSRLQYSVFECPLDKQRLAEVKAKISEVLHHEEDQVLFVSLGADAKDAGLIIESLGMPYTERTRVTII